MQKQQRRFAEYRCGTTRTRLQPAGMGLDRRLRARTTTLCPSRASIYAPPAAFVGRALPSHSSSGCHDFNPAPHSHGYPATTGVPFDFDHHNLQIRGLPSPPDGTVTAGVDVAVRIRPR